MIAKLSSGAPWLWKKSPALCLGLQFLLGIAFASTKDLFLIFIAILLLLPFVLQKMQVKTYICALSCLLGLIYGNFQNGKEYNVLDPIKGYAVFSPTSVQLQTSHFHSSYVYKGELQYFSSDEGETLTHLPCRLYAPSGSDRPLASSSYFLKGVLCKVDRHGAEFQAEGSWQKVDNTYSFAETRFKAKKAFQKFVNKQLPNKKVASFLYALCSGEVEDKLMSYEFSKLGLQHILAVSGFHFALIALFIGFIIKKILPEKAALIFLILSLSLYFFFLGNSPSVFRAWIAITLWAIGRLFNKKSSGLNTLGVCLLIELLYSPNCIFHLGFQLSFLCTAAILLCTPTTIKWMLLFFPKRSSDEILNLPKPDRIGYVGCCFFRSALAITIAVHIVSVPVCLYYFHTFPLLSLVYNLFFPLLTGLSMFSFMSASLLAFFLPPVSKLLNVINTQFTSFLMQMSASPPQLLHYSINVSAIPLWIVLLYLSLLLHLFSFFAAEQKNKY